MSAAAELLMLKGMISDFSPQQKLDVHLMVEVVTDLVKENPPAALVAIALVALQAQVSPESYGLPT